MRRLRVYAALTILLAAIAAALTIGLSSLCLKFCDDARAEQVARAMNNPDAMTLLGGRYYEQGKYDLALRLYSEAAVIRPNSAALWVRIAAIWAFQRHFDDYADAIESANRLGPWEPLVQVLTVRTGLSHWSDLDSHTRGLVLGAAQRGLQSQSRSQSVRVMALLTEFNALALVCTDGYKKNSYHCEYE
jgi:tetratricopeptide (TPR) repeat protein